MPARACGARAVACPCPRRRRRAAAAANVADAPSQPKQASARLVLTERASGGSLRRYTLFGDALVSSPSPPTPGAADSTQNSEAAPPSGDEQASIPARLARFFLPPGWPASVSPDYLRYALLVFPTHATGLAAASLATAALLRSVGLPTAIAVAAPPALSAGLKWALKDGVGSAGRLVVAGRLAPLLDAAPRQWRLYAELVATAGGALEVATSLSPASLFLPLAAGGTFLKAAAKAMASPAHSVILQHFAVASNLGAVAAKEEVQEVAAQLVGLALAAAVLRSADGGSASSPGADPSAAIAGAWALIAGAHLALRSFSLSGLVFRSLNVRRALVAASAHVGATAPPGAPFSTDNLMGRNHRAATAAAPHRGMYCSGGWASFEAINAAEPLATPDWAAPLRVRVGCTVADAVAAAEAAEEAAASTSAACAPATAAPPPPAWPARLMRALPSRPRHDAHTGGGGGERVAAAHAACRGERFVLIRDGHGLSAVLLRDGATPRDCMRAIWLAAAVGPGGAASAGEEGAAVADGIARLGAHFASFEAAIVAEGWDIAPLLPRGSDSPRLLVSDDA